MKKHILVTGSPGWLGTRLVEVLMKQNKDVRCLVQHGVDSCHVERIGAKVVWGDIRDKYSLLNVTKNIETVYHCAGVIHPEKVSDFYEINVGGTYNLLEVSVSSNVKRFIYVSSNSAQGFNDNNNKMTEEQRCNPESRYGKSKLQAERIVNQFNQDFNIETIIVRPTMYYGPRQPIRHTKMMRMIKYGRPPVFGGGRVLRSLTYIDNLVDALILAGASDISGETYWIADEKVHTWIDYLDTIAKVMNVDLNPRYLPMWLGKTCELADKVLQLLHLYSINLHVAGELTRNIVCDISKAKRELNYNPKISLKQGITNAVKWATERGLL